MISYNIELTGDSIMTKKHLVIGVSGGIAAYKACDLVSKLGKKNYEIRVILTENAEKFVPKLTFEALSKHPCEQDLFTSEDPIAHISLATWADAMILVPATANILAKVVHGLADDMLTTTFLAATCPKMICPAMNVHMYENEVTQANLQKARQLGYHVLEPVEGHLACDVNGKGKLPDVADIVEAIDRLFENNGLLKGKHVLISAGPTQEPLDPVRFISNHSSGKQGYAIAQAALKMGAEVTIVSGPVSIDPVEGAHIIPVRSARDMYEAIKENLEQADYIIMSAAVADYRPAEVADHKIKKDKGGLAVTFVRNPDILAYIGQHKRDDQIVCGFAMETQDLEKNAKEKLVKKNCDMLIANNLFTEGAGFKTDTNVVSVLTKETIQRWPKLSKYELGLRILETMSDIEKSKRK